MEYFTRVNSECQAYPLSGGGGLGTRLHHLYHITTNISCILPHCKYVIKVKFRM